MKERVPDHFDSLADSYDHWKRKNWYYYEELKRIAKSVARPGDHVLDAGCGTGAILAELDPALGVGIDISRAMVRVARTRHGGRAGLRFETSDISEFRSGPLFDLVLCLDVVEHLEHPGAALAGLEKLVKPGGRILVTMANPLWEPILMAGEKLGLKMPEGPHARMSPNDLTALAEKSGLRLVRRDWRLLFPKYVPGLSRVLNEWVGRAPFVRRLSLIEIFVFGTRRDGPVDDGRMSPGSGDR